MLVDVLIVEDEPVVAESAARILRTAGLSVRTAVDAPSAISELRNNAVRVVLCDLMLPGDSGFRVLETSRDLRPLTQVIMITGYATRENAVESFKAGAFDFLPKPFDVDELLATVTRALRCFDRAAGADSTEPAPTAMVGSASTRPTGLYFLGRHTWVANDADGSATLGLGETFPGLLGSALEIRIPKPDEHVLQGRECALIRTRDRLEHRVLAPLSGRVIAVNRALEADPGQLDHEPWEACWLVRIVPTSPTQELSNLIHH